MRKLISISILLIILISTASAVDYNSERVFYYTDGGTWNITNVNLGMAYYVPKYGTIYNSNANVGSPENGTYAKATNVIGNVGCAYTDHSLKFTISTSGRFVSQSDPTKYREFVIAGVPRYRLSNDETYKYKPSLNEKYADSDRVPNTRNGDIVVYSPPMPKDGNNAYSKVTFYDGTKNVAHYYIDLCICMDELTTEDYLHLSENNDYIATITITWECTDPDCTKTSGDNRHFGSFIFAINGYYGDGYSGSYKDIFLQVTPEVSALNLDLVNIAASTPNDDIKVSDLQLFTTTKNNDWVKKLSVFISASQSYNSASANGFRLVNDNGYYIPYVVVVKDYNLSTGTETGTTNAVFTGTTAYSNNMSNKISLSQYYLVGKKTDNKAYSIAYGANVYIRFVDNGRNTQDSRVAGSSIPSTGDIIAYSQSDTTGQVVKDAGSNDPIVANTVSNRLSGIYTSNIYYYIISN